MTPCNRPLLAAQAEFTEKRSRFIGQLTPVSSEEEALSFLDERRKKHREATHNVYAYRLKDGGVCRHSDDGEPSGTAGIPLLNGFVQRHIYDFCCVATRYHGGIMLGAGGLVRAYARCGVVALEASGVGAIRETVRCAATLSYMQYEPVKRLLALCGADISSEDFGTEVALKFVLPAEELPELQSKINTLTAGTVTINN